MTAEALLRTLRERGVELTTDGAELRYRARKGALTAELCTAIAEHRAELLGLVERRLPTTARNLAAVAALLTFGDILAWPALRIAPHMEILAGEDGWTKFAQCPPPGALEAALAAAKARLEEAMPL